MSYYLQACKDADVQVVALYDPHYIPKDGDFVVLEPSRRFIETQKYFDVLEGSGMSHDDVRVGPVLASTIYRFQASAQVKRRLDEGSTLTQLNESHPQLEAHVRESASADPRSAALSDLTRRFTQ